MHRVTRAIQLKPECEAEYIRLHREVWPGVLATITACNIRNYSIFMRGHVLVAYFEYHGEDLGADMRKMAACPETRRWWAMVDPMQSPMEDAAPGEWWSDMQEVFHFEG